MTQNKPEEIYQFLDFADSNARYMHSLVRDILEFSKISKVENSLVEVDLHDVVFDVIRNLQSYIEERNAVLQFDYLPIIMANETQIHQLFQNLIENGIKYNESKPNIKIYTNYGFTKYRR